MEILWNELFLPFLVVMGIFFLGLVAQEVAMFAIARRRHRRRTTVREKLIKGIFEEAHESVASYEKGKLSKEFLASHLKWLRDQLREIEESRR